MKVGACSGGHTVRPWGGGTLFVNFTLLFHSQGFQPLLCGLEPEGNAAEVYLDLYWLYDTVSSAVSW
jgi:hypothetical protein